MLHLEIITPDRIAYTNQVDMVVVPGVDGQLGILPRHVGLFAQLIEGELKIKTGNEEIFLSIGGGFVEVTKTKVIVLVTRAVHASQLNEAEIVKAQAAARNALNQKPDPSIVRAAQVLLRQSIVDMRLLNKRKQRVH